MTQNDGGPAFPCEWVDLNSIGESTTRQQYPGASLRDLFAAAALARLAGQMVDDGGISRYDRTAASAYRYADAMLRAREES